MTTHHVTQIFAKKMIAKYGQPGSMRIHRTWIKTYEAFEKNNHTCKSPEDRQ